MLAVGNTKYSPSERRKLKNALWQVITFVSLKNTVMGSTDSGCPRQTAHQSLTVNIGESAYIRVFITPIWAYSEEALVFKNDKGIVKGKCLGERALYPENVLFNITCTTHKESGFLLSADTVQTDSCIAGCLIDFTVTPSEHSETGTYFLALQETACQFWMGHIFFRDFKPTCKSAFLSKSKTLKFSCKWFMINQNGKAWLKNQDRMLHETKYNGKPNMDGNLTNSISLLVEFEDIFSVSKVPDICIVSQFDIDKNCTFTPITPLNLSLTEGTKIANATLNCCSDNKIGPAAIWLYNKTDAFKVNMTKEQKKCEYGMKAGLVCGADSVKEIITYSIGTLTQKCFTVSLVNASEDSSCSHKYIITITAQPNEPSDHKLSSFPVTLTSFTNDKPRVSSSMPSQMTLCPISFPPSRSLPSQPASPLQAHTNIMYISVLATASLLALLCVGSCFCHYKFLKSRRNTMYCTRSGPQEMELGRNIPTTRTNTGGDMNENLAIGLSSFGRNPPGMENNDYAFEEEMSQERLTGYRQDGSKPDVRQSDDPTLGAVGGENRFVRQCVLFS